MKKKVWFYDIEVFPNFFCITFKSRDDGEKHIFIIHDTLNQVKQLLKFLKSRCEGLIGFNNLNYDYPVLHFILVDLRLRKLDDPSEITRLLYSKSKEITNPNNRFTAIPPWEMLIPQLDLFRIHHFDNKAKGTSLKEVQFVLRWEDVNDIDLDFNVPILNRDIEKIIEYNVNDVLSTERFYYQTIEDIQVRKGIKKKFGIDCLNLNDPKIGETLFLEFIAKATGIEKQQIKQMRTHRKYIDLKECILPYISFKSIEFKEVHKQMLNTTIYGTKGDFKKKIKYKGVKYEFASGGLHACVRPGIYEKGNGYIIVDIDVASFYPRLAVVNRFYPEHLGRAFCDIYTDRYNYRMQIKKDKDKKLEAGTWKLALNGVYGKSNDVYSFLYDPKYTMRITYNGQLLLTMLIERILLLIKDSTMLQANTDGVTFKIPESEYDNLKELCKKWEARTNLELEYTEYKKIIIRDVNNYIGVYDKPEEELFPSFPESDWYDNHYTKHKTKGAFQIVCEQNGKVAFNKDWGQRIVPKALYNYFIYGIPVKQTILNCTDIHDFCKRFRAKKVTDHNILWDVVYVDSQGKEHEMTRTTRYYMTVGGGRLRKDNPINNNSELVEAEGSVAIFNKYEKKPIEDYMIDYSYYIKKCNKEINKIENNGQLVLQY